MCIRDRLGPVRLVSDIEMDETRLGGADLVGHCLATRIDVPVSYTHLRAHETVLDLVCRLLLEKKKHHLQNTSLLDYVLNRNIQCTENNR